MQEWMKCHILQLNINAESFEYKTLSYSDILIIKLSEFKYKYLQMHLKTR